MNALRFLIIKNPSMKSLVFLLLLSLSSSVVFSQTPEKTRAEIDRLLVRLEKSGCLFNRNGTWYSSVDARKHLEDKYDYIAKHGQIKSTEEFIDLAATKSSVSGKNYEVKCNNKPTQPSKEWLKNELLFLHSNK